MNNLDIEIYMSNFVGFFDKNPAQLKQLIGEVDPQKFFTGVRNIVEENSKEEEKPIEPTRKQIIDLIVDLNGGKKVEKSAFPVMEHHMGNIIMN